MTADKLIGGRWWGICLTSLHRINMQVIYIFSVILFNRRIFLLYYGIHVVSEVAKFINI